MAKARSRTAARKVKDRWKAKRWFNVLAPASFENATIAQTLANDPNRLIGRVTGISMQDLTNDFRRSHILLYFKIHEVEDSNAYTHFVGHSLTSDYLRRMIRRRRSKVEGVYDITTRDGAKIRIKPFATTDKRIQNSQKKIIRESMKKTIVEQAKSSTLSEFIRDIIDGKMGRDIYKNCKKLYPVKRVEIYKTELVSSPTRDIKEEKPKKKIEESKEKKTEEKKTKEPSEKQKTKEKEKPKENKPEQKEEQKPKKESKDKKAKQKRTEKKKKTKQEPKKPKEEVAKKKTKSTKNKVKKPKKKT